MSSSIGKGETRRYFSAKTVERIDGETHAAPQSKPGISYLQHALLTLLDDAVFHGNVMQERGRKDSIPMGEFIKPGLRILMADDSEEDRFFVQRALDSSGFGTFFFGVKDGQEAIDYLRAIGPFADRKAHPFPNVLLLDLKMPRLGGFDVLKWLGAHPECKVIPTIIFSSSAMESDVHQSYVLGANAFIVKPTSPGELRELIQLTYNFWSRCETPPPPPNGRCA